MTKRFFISQQLTTGNVKILDTEIIHQFKNVLRLKVGDEVILLDNSGREAVARLVTLDKKVAEVEIDEIVENKNEPKVDINLYCAILKRENFELVVQKATELGVRRIVPLMTARTVKQGLKRERLEKIICEAAEQSGRGRLPELGEVVEFDEVVNRELEGLNIFFHISVANPPSSAATDFGVAKQGGVNLFIGPEGGWSDEEVKIVEKIVEENQNWQFAKISNTTLRAETAAIVSVFYAKNIEK